jgi:hypothetical protein
MARRGVFVRAEEVVADKLLEPKAPVCGRHLEALRAVAENPGGLRQEAYPSAMPALEKLGLVVSRRPGAAGGGGVGRWIRPGPGALAVSTALANRSHPRRQCSRSDRPSATRHRKRAPRQCHRT